MKRSCIPFMRLMLLFLMLPLFSHAQVNLNGKVVEASTGKAIPYATIGLLKQNTGTNANEDGEFSMSCTQPDLDTLIISCVGFATHRISVKDFTANAVAALSLNVKRMKTVVIKNKWNVTEVGSSKKTLTQGLTTTGYQWQAATKLIAPGANTLLQSIQIRTSKYGGDAIFRIHVFDFDSLTKGPGAELTDTVIEVNSKPGITTIDMQSYQVTIPGKEFFVSVEWLRIPFNAKIFRTSFEGKETQMLNYNPTVCFTKQPQSSPDEIWALAYSGNWSPMTDKKYFPNSLAISATVKY